MKKSNLHKFLYAVSALLLLGFAIRFGVDAYRYDISMGSAPLYAYAILRAVQFILPGFLVFLGAIFTKKKFGNKEDNK